MSVDNKNLSSFLELAIVAARTAGQRAFEDIDYAKASNKTPTELVTETDPVCQQIIIDTIRSRFPDHGFIGEEGDGGGRIFKRQPSDASDIWWVIDPLDGTNNFAGGILDFCVSIGCIHQGRPILGVIFAPCTDSIYTGTRDSGLQYNGRSVHICQSSFTMFDSIGIEGLFSQGFPPFLSKLFEQVRCRSLGTTALQLAYVAKGSFIANICHRPKLWDIAAGSFLIELAGGIVSDFQGNPIWPVDTASYDGHTFELLASGSKQTHSRLLELIGSP